MAIDRIGKPGMPTTVAPPSSPSSPDAAHRFAVDGAAVRGPVPGASAAGSVASASPPVGPLEQLRAGAITADGYLDSKVSEATAHLVALAPAHLEAVRSTLRERLATDPMFVDLVRTATGALASPPPNARDD